VLNELEWSEADASASVVVHGGYTCENLACNPAAPSIMGIAAANATGTETGDFLGGGRLYVLPTLGIRKFSLHEDVAYTLMSFVILLPAVAACITFLCQRAAGLFLRHRALMFVAPAIVLLLQVRLLTSWLSNTNQAVVTAWLFPLALPLITTIDLVVSPRSGPLSFRLPLAALTICVPTFLVLELHRFRTTSQAVATSKWASWPELMGLCSSSHACGAPQGI